MTASDDADVTATQDMDNVILFPQARSRGVLRPEVNSSGANLEDRTGLRDSAAWRRRTAAGARSRARMLPRWWPSD